MLAQLRFCVKMGTVTEDVGVEEGGSEASEMEMVPLKLRQPATTMGVVARLLE